MSAVQPRAWGEAVGSAIIRQRPEDFLVVEELDFVPSGEGEHAFLFIEKRGLNTADLVQRLARFCQVPPRDVGYSGLKDRNAVTRQWLSIGLAGREEPDWAALDDWPGVRVLEVARHRRKLRRGVHKRNRFTLVLRELVGEREQMASRLAQIRAAGVPNYFGEQRFGRDGRNLEQALAWLRSGRKVSRNRRSLGLSVLRSHLFNYLLGQRVSNDSWCRLRPGDTCMLHGTHSVFVTEEADEPTAARLVEGDLHLAAPLWGKGVDGSAAEPWREALATVPDGEEIANFLEARGPDLSWRAARVLPDDFCWQFCDDGSLQLEFALGAGSFATALLAEFVHYKEGRVEGEAVSEHG